MSENVSNSPNPVVNQVTETAATQEGFGGKTQAELEKMSGTELREYFEAQKNTKNRDQTTQQLQKNAPQLQNQKQSDPIKEAAKEAIRKYKLKVDGEEIEVDEEELKRGYSHQRAANKKLQEGMAARRQAEEFISMMRDPEKFYETAKKLGHDPRSLAENYLARQLEYELMDPRERELREAKAQLEHMKQLDKLRDEAIKKQRDEILTKKYAKDYSDQFVAALKESGLPAEKETVKRIAMYIGRASKIGFKMTAQEAAQLVREDIEREQVSIIRKSDGETLLRLLGEDVANKIRKYDTQRLKNPESMLTTPTDQSERKPRPSSNKGRMTTKEWREYNRR